MKKITRYTSLAFFLITTFVGVSNADTSLGAGTVYESCENNKKKMNIYREDLAYKQMFKLNKKGNTIPCRFGLVDNESPVINFLNTLF
tara:strand:+ start:165 stop:428 length:264 start_codon:yes stop_codon:yes gene_type:complete